jgi:flagellar biosynthetic protein FliO
MTARLLTILALALPLTACAAQQTGAGQAAGPSAAATTAAGQETRPATQAQAPTPTTAPAPVVTEPAAAPAHQATQPGAPSAAPAATHPRAVAVPQTPAVQPDTAAAPTGTAAPANPAVPDVAAPRPVTPGAPTPGATVPPVTMPSGSSTGSLLQTLFALILVLAVLGALAWFLKRYGPKGGGGNANVRVVGSLNLGGRERIVVVEVGNEWIVVGASPGRINALATMPRQDGQNGEAGGANATLAPHAPAAHSFADWLKQTIDKRK